MLSRLTPSARSPAREAKSTDSGLASAVTSASGARPNSSWTALSTAPKSRAGNRVGVPPPKNTVRTGRSTRPSTRRASRTSAIAVVAYDACDAPPPSSAAV